ncbi:DoxX family protein [Aureimonas populi]|uniref:DoxX family protein n=1 Tax=Aureimonas populi TaxID=1701758 RepID=A0ABW5CQ02_9HYPH|nr:DoxX family protein [Aureimonas populi]
MSHYTQDRRLVVPALGSLYASLDTVAFAVLRVVTGIALIAHGWGKITNPFGAAGMVESLGFYPGALFSPLLAGAEFFGGILLVLGLLTRPAAFVTLFVLLVTVYAHWIAWGEGYSGAEHSILWSAVLFLFAVRGGGRWSVDARIGREI